MLATRCTPAIRVNYQRVLSGVDLTTVRRDKKLEGKLFDVLFVYKTRNSFDCLRSRDARTRSRCQIFARFPDRHPLIPTPLCRNITIVLYADVVRRPTESVLSLFYTCYDRPCFQSSPLTIVNLVRDRCRNMQRKEEQTRGTNSKPVSQISWKIVAVRTNNVTWINGEGRGYDPREKKITDLQDS